MSASRKSMMLDFDPSLAREQEIPTPEKIRGWYERAFKGDWVAIEYLYCQAVVGVKARESEQRRRRASKRQSLQFDVFICAAKMIFEGEIRFDARGFATAVALEMTLQGHEITAPGVRKHLTGNFYEGRLREYQVEQDEGEKNL